LRQHFGNNFSQSHFCVITIEFQMVGIFFGTVRKKRLLDGHVRELTWRVEKIADFSARVYGFKPCRLSPE